MNLAELPAGPAGAAPVAVLRWRGGRRSTLTDLVADEVAIAFEYNGVSHAVMMATPTELDDFALGFSLAEGIIERADELYDCEAEAGRLGITLHLEIAARRYAELQQRRRNLIGRTGCGLCGAAELAQVGRMLPRVPAVAPLRAAALSRAVGALRAQQRLGQATGATHAAAWCSAAGDVALLREDVGRHNALDKLIGALARRQQPAAAGFIAVTSRASVEMVQKAAIAGVPLLVAVSAPTRLAIDTAQAAGLALVGLARGDDLVVYCGDERIELDGD
jgi:FdhD protein